MEALSLKKAAAAKAITYLRDDIVLGVGTGSTVDCFIELLGPFKSRLKATVASSVRTAELLKAKGFSVQEFNHVDEITLYVDGADEFLLNGTLLKGGGGALVREKILATAAKQFICMVDSSKKVDYLSQRCPLPVEVLPFARSSVARTLRSMGGAPIYREGFVSDNQNVILDVFNLSIENPKTLEEQLKLIPGVIDCGIFEHRRADVLLVAGEKDVDVLTY